MPVENQYDSQLIVARVLDIQVKLLIVCQKAQNQYTPKNCPLNSRRLNHYDDSRLLFGQGCHTWNCGFCGEEFIG